MYAYMIFINFLEGDVDLTYQVQYLLILLFSY